MLFLVNFLNYSLSESGYLFFVLILFVMVLVGKANQNVLACFFDAAKKDVTAGYGIYHLFYFFFRVLCCE